MVRVLAFNVPNHSWELKIGVLAQTFVRHRRKYEQLSITWEL